MKILLLVFTLVFSGQLMAADLRYINPQQEFETTPLRLAMLDLAVPGWGMFHHNRPWWGAGYATAKVGGAFLIFVALRNYNFWNSAANSANSFQAGQPGTVFFKDPTGSSDPLSAQDLQNKADGAFLLMVYAIAFEALVYGISFYHTYSYTSEKQKKAEPFYQVLPDGESKTGSLSSPVPGRLAFGYRRYF